jgi:hypothetical protein
MIISLYWIKITKNLDAKLKQFQQIPVNINCWNNILITQKAIMTKLKLDKFMKLLDLINSKHSIKKLETICFCGMDLEFLISLVFYHKV